MRTRTIAVQFVPGRRFHVCDLIWPGALRGTDLQYGLCSRGTDLQYELCSRGNNLQYELCSRGTKLQYGVTRRGFGMSGGNPPLRELVFAIPGLGSFVFSLFFFLFLYYIILFA